MAAHAHYVCRVCVYERAGRYKELPQLPLSPVPTVGNALHGALCSTSASIASTTHLIEWKDYLSAQVDVDMRIFCEDRVGAIYLCTS